jgi:hypothetical protein
MFNMKSRWIAVIAGINTLFLCSPANASYQQRLSLGVGVVAMSNSSQTNFTVSGDYEYRVDPLLGLGVAANYVFSNPGIALIAIPDVFFHPLAGDWYVSAAPLIEFGSSAGTNVGVRLGTRIPLPLGPITLVPSFAVDLMNGWQNYIFGLGLQL